MRRAQGALTLLTASALVAVMACQARPAQRPPDLTRLAAIGTTPEDSYGLFGDSLYVATTTGATPSVTAYHMPDGARMWTAPLPDGTRHAAVREAAYGLALVDADGAVLAIDAATGTVRWRARGHALGWAIGGATVVTFDAADARGIVHAGVRADTGEPVWEDVLGADEQYGIDHRAAPPSPIRNRSEVSALVVVRRPDGATRVRDAASGALRRGRVHPIGGQSPVVVVDDLLLVSYPIGARGEIAGYDLSDLKHRWTVPGGFSQATGCGPVVCLNAGTLIAIDPATGWRQWRQTDASVAWPVPDAPAGPLLGFRDGSPGADDGGEPVVMRADTGAVIMRLSPWRVLGSDGSRLLLLRHADGTAAQDGLGASDQLGLADLEAGTVRVLGALPAVAPACYERDTTSPGCPRPFGRPGQCRPGSGWAVCDHTDGQIRVWRYTVG